MRQLVFVNDGYNDVLDVGGERIIFRPFMRRERMELLQLKPNKPLLEEAMHSRIVGGGIKFNLLDEKEWQQAFKGIIPAGDVREKNDVNNLQLGVRIEKLYPHLNRTSCKWCQAKWFDPIDGTTAMDGKAYLDRPAGSGLMCDDGECPKGRPEAPRSFSQRNAQAYLHYGECSATGQWPDDPIVQRNAKVIGEALTKMQKEASGSRR